MEGQKCSKCKAVVGQGSFCSQCGTPFVSGAINKELPAWKEKYVQGFYRGAIISKTEHWSFENGEVVMVKGKGTCRYVWLGDLFEIKDSTTDQGCGRYDGENITWHYSDMDTPFYSYKIAADEKSVECTAIAFGTTKWNFAFNGNDFQTNDGVLEGTDDSFQVTGDVPLPVAVFCSMWSKAKLLHDKWVEKNKRQYARCGKVVLSAGVNPKLCDACSQLCANACFVCGGKTEVKHKGNACKNCTPKIRGLCGRCSDPLKGSKTEGMLCQNCGLGSRQMNCCRMVFGSNI